jgi:glycosyltransferase involved in cell wall biosynthesis
VRVLSVVPLYPPHHLGGYEVVCRGVMDRFAAGGHDVLVLTSDTRLPDREEPDDSQGGVSVERTLQGWWDWESHGQLQASFRQRLAIERHNQRAVRDVLERFRPDVVSIWSLVYLSFSIVTRVERAGVPLVVSLGDDWITYAPGLDEWTRMFDRRPWLRSVARLTGVETRLPTFAGATVTAASEMIRDSVAKTARWKFADVPIIRMGIETRDFPLADPHPERWAWRLLYVGRVVPNKGIATAIKALPSLPEEARLDVDGYGAPEVVDELAALARRLGVSDRVTFGRSPRSALAGRYREADVVLFPSEWAEPFGLVPLEAMARGTPVVATGTGGSGEFLHDDVNCLLFPPGDPAALAGAVRRLAADVELRRRIAEGGARTAGEMTIDRYAERLEAVHVAAAGRVSSEGVRHRARG